MSTRSTIAAFVLITAGAGCDQQAIVEEGGGEAQVAANREANPLVDPVLGPDPGFGSAVRTDMVDRDRFDAWDADADAMIDEREFRTRFNEAGWVRDTDGDGMLSEEEFSAAATAWGDAPEGVDSTRLFHTWDTDGDGLVDNNEAAAGAFAAWDRDDNRVIDPREFEQGVDWFGR